MLEGYPREKSKTSDFSRSVHLVYRQGTEAFAKLETMDFNALVASITEAGVSVKQPAADPHLHQAIASIDRVVSDPDLKPR